MGNHYLENAFSLFIASYSLDDKNLHQKSLSILKSEVLEQILLDGAHFECTPMYHSILLSKFLLCLDTVRNNLNLKSDDLFFEQTSIRMLSWLKSYSFKNGSFALMNDAALGIAPTVSQINASASLLK